MCQQKQMYKKISNKFFIDELSWKKNTIDPIDYRFEPSNS